MSSEGLALRANLLGTIKEISQYISSKPKECAILLTQLEYTLDKMESDLSLLGSGGISSNLVRQLFLRLTRERNVISEQHFLAFCVKMKVIPILLNENEAVQAYRAAYDSEGHADSNGIGLEGFLQLMEICGLAFARPPHNVKPELCQQHLLRYLGLPDGSFRKRLDDPNM